MSRAHTPITCSASLVVGNGIELRAETALRECVGDRLERPFEHWKLRGGRLDTESVAGPADPELQQARDAPDLRLQVLHQPQVLRRHGHPFGISHEHAGVLYQADGKMHGIEIADDIGPADARLDERRRYAVLRPGSHAGAVLRQIVDYIPVDDPTDRDP